MDPTREAERLNAILDRRGLEVPATDDGDSEWSTVFRALRTADGSTPDPAPEFVASLLASLEQREKMRSAQPRRAGSVGIVSSAVPMPFPLHPRQWLTVGAVVGSLILALVASGLELPGGRSRSLGVATVSASSTAIAPTPTQTSVTVTTVPTVNRG